MSWVWLFMAVLWIAWGWLYWRVEQCLLRMDRVTRRLGEVVDLLTAWNGDEE